MEYWVAKELEGQVQWETKSFQVNRGVEQELRKAKAGKKKVSHSQHEMRQEGETVWEPRSRNRKCHLYFECVEVNMKLYNTFYVAELS